MLPSVFHHRNQHDMIDFLTEHNIKTIVEDNGRVLLKSGKSKELLELLTHLAHGNDTEIFLSQNISDIKQLPDGHFLITTQDNEYHTKKLIIAS
jgi:predicted flavoprotein YhiN